jgi:hypothetical protein
MILHDRCDVVIEALDSEGVGTVIATQENVPCNLSPINSQPAGDSGPITTRYLFIMTFDAAAFRDAQAAGSKRISIDYRGKRLQLDGGFERHRVNGQIHHTEAIVLDFGY